jgi:hypothetical protein
LAACGYLDIGLEEDEVDEADIDEDERAEAVERAADAFQCDPDDLRDLSLLKTSSGLD